MLLRHWLMQLWSGSQGPQGGLTSFLRSFESGPTAGRPPRIAGLFVKLLFFFVKKKNQWPFLLEAWSPCHGQNVGDVPRRAGHGHTERAKPWHHAAWARRSGRCPSIDRSLRPGEAVRNPWAFCLLCALLCWCFLQVRNRIERNRESFKII